MTMTVVIKSRSKDLTLPKAEVDPAADPQGNEPIAAAKGYLPHAIIGGIVLTLFLVIYDRWRDPTSS